MSGIALSDLHAKLRAWVDDQMRVDTWTLDQPSGLGVQINTTWYPANTVYLPPGKNIEFMRSDFGVDCEATFALKITYRFSKALSYEDLPVMEAEGLLNNLYLQAISSPAEISEHIRMIFTDEERAQVMVGQVNEADSDWLIQISPAFRFKFKPAKAILNILQPEEIEPPVKIFNLDIKIYNAKSEFKTSVPGDFRLDRTIHRE